MNHITSARMQCNDSTDGLRTNPFKELLELPRHAAYTVSSRRQICRTPHLLEGARSPPTTPPTAPSAPSAASRGSPSAPSASANAARTSRVLPTAGAGRTDDGVLESERSASRRLGAGLPLRRPGLGHSGA